MKKASRGNPGVLYITSLFPVLTQTFISREIIELEKRGLEVEIVSLRNSPQEVGAEELPKAGIMYIPYFFSIGLWRAALRTVIKYKLRIAVECGRVFLKLAPKPLRALKFLCVFPKCLYLLHYLEREGYRHVHAHWATVPATCAYFLHRVAGIRYSFSAHAWDIFVEGNELLLKEKLETAEKVFTCTDYNRRALLEKHGNESRIVLMYHGLDVSHYPFNLPVDAEVPLVAAGGSLVPQKGLEVLLRGLAVLKERGMEFKCVIFGEGPEKKRLLGLARGLGLEGEVEFTGSMPHREVVEILGRAHLFVMPSVVAGNRFIDGLPNVVAEAMASGAVVIASRISGIPELIDDGEDGILVPPGDPGAIARSMTLVLADAEKMAGIARAARDKIEKRFDINRNIVPLYEYLHSTCSGEDRL